MGREIQQTAFATGDFVEFKARLARETALLGEWLRDGVVSADTGSCGLELEAWLVDKHGNPSASNARFLDAFHNPLVVPELSQFNFEINSRPQAPTANMLERIRSGLAAQWQDCDQQARRLGLRVAQIGILPTLRDGDLTLRNVSDQQRYIALNNQILRGRGNRPLVINIHGDRDQLCLEHDDVMAEAATTSLQIHLQVAPAAAVRFYNAAVIASAPMVAAGANSPFLFGHHLWQETRIPLFEQSVAVPCFLEGGKVINRVTFGSGYLNRSVFELFEENLRDFPVLLPMLDGSPDNPLSHLSLHNGTIWRWNRPLVGFDDAGKPHVRIEHRVVPAGPTVDDVVANIAFFYGLAHYLAELPVAPESQLIFELARQNFYRAARLGLNAKVEWCDGGEQVLQDLITDKLLPAAAGKLRDLGIAAADVDYYLGEVMNERVASGRTGANWQERFEAAHPGQFAAMVERYLDNQDRGPVHQWAI